MQVLEVLVTPHTLMLIQWLALFQLIEINMFLTGPIRVDDAFNIVTHDVGSATDAITMLCSPMNVS